MERAPVSERKPGYVVETANDGQSPFDSVGATLRDVSAQREEVPLRESPEKALPPPGGRLADGFRTHPYL